jgi:hypothetical protein
MSVQINVEKAKFVDPSPYGFTIYTKQPNNYTCG